MKYILRKKSNELLFYVDRTKTKRFWWSYDLSFAFLFESEEAAEHKASSMRYGEFEVITLDRAKQLRLQKTNDYFDSVMPEEDDHPFSSSGLGQW